MAYNDELVSLRKRKGLSQAELAQQTGLSRSAISMYESGKSEPTLDTFKIFADFYRVDMNTITGQTHKSNYTIPEKNGIVVSVGERIKALRTLIGITQEELGACCGASKQTIYKYESGVVANIPMDKLEAIAMRLNVPPPPI